MCDTIMLVRMSRGFIGKHAIVRNSIWWCFWCGESKFIGVRSNVFSSVSYVFIISLGSSSLGIYRGLRVEFSGLLWNRNRPPSNCSWPLNFYFLGRRELFHWLIFCIIHVQDVSFPTFLYIGQVRVSKGDVIPQEGDTISLFVDDMVSSTFMGPSQIYH